MKNYLYLLILITAFSGCSSLNIEKRKYNKGYHISWAKPVHVHSTSEPEDDKVLAYKETTDVTIIESTPTPSSNAQLEEKTTESMVAFEPQKEATNKDVIQSPVRTTSKNTKSSRARPISTKTSLNNSHKSINSLWFYSVFAMLPLILLFKKKVSQVDLWSQKNISKGKWLIALFTLTGSASSFLLGAMFNWEIPSLFTPLAIGLIGGAFGLYWIKLKSGFNFLKQKIAIGLMSLAGLAGSFGLGIQHGSLFMNPIINDGGEMAIHPVGAAILTIIILAALAASYYGLLMVACNIACAGYDALAILFFLGTSYLATSLAVFAILHATSKVDEDTSRFWNKATLASVFIVIGVGLVLLLISAVQ